MGLLRVNRRAGGSAPVLVEGGWIEEDATAVVLSNSEFSPSLRSDLEN